MMRKIDEIIVHCSATPEGRDVSMADIRRWHVEERGWSDVGYHFVVTLDGTVHIGRPLTAQVRIAKAVTAIQSVYATLGAGFGHGA